MIAQSWRPVSYRGGVASIFRRNRPNLPGGSPLTHAIGYGLVAVSVLVFFYSIRMDPPTLGLDEETFTSTWNHAAEEAGRSDLMVGDLQQTADDVVGFAWSNDLLVLARIETDAEEPRPVVEVAAVGSPGRDGTDNVLAVLELVIAVVAPELGADERSDILTELSLVAENRPALINAVVRHDGIEFRSTSDSDGEIGIGAVAVPSL